MARFQPLTRGVIRTRANLQLLSVQEGRAENISEFELLGGLPGSLNIRGTASVMKGTEQRRLFVTFTEFILSLLSLRLRVPLTWVKPTGRMGATTLNFQKGSRVDPKRLLPPWHMHAGWVETTYLDEGGFRVGRGDKGSIFVATRASQGPRGNKAARVTGK